jgi:hypothetical protein
MSLRFVPADDRRPSKEDFGVEVVGDELRIPYELAGAFKRLAIRTPEEFVSYVLTFPGAVARELSWAPGEVNAAAAGLIRLLRGFVAESLLTPSGRREPPLGARNPNDARPNKHRGG